MEYRTERRERVPLAPILSDDVFPLVHRVLNRAAPITALREWRRWEIARSAAFFLNRARLHRLADYFFHPVTGATFVGPAGNCGTASGTPVTPQPPLYYFLCLGQLPQ